MTVEQNKAAVMRFFGALNSGELDTLGEVLAPDYIEQGIPTGFPQGIEGFKQFIGMLSGAFPDLHVAVRDAFGEGDRVAARVTVSGTHRGILMGTIQPTGVHATWEGIDIFRLVDGKIVERWNSRDLLGLMRQVGVVRD